MPVEEGAMQMKRLFAAVMLLMVLGACLSAQAAPIAIYVMPDGAQVSYLLEADFDVPAGMQPAYDLMYNATPRGDIYLIRMKNGYGLASVSCSELKRELSMQDLLDRWPQIAQAISEEAAIQEGAQAFADTLFDDRKVLHIQAVLDAGSAETPLMLDAEAFAFSRGTEFLEVWTLCAQGDDAAIVSDRADLAAFVESLAFPEDDSNVLQGVPYQDARGFFSMMTPKDSVVLTPQSSQQEIADARARYIAANADGASTFFDSWEEDIRELKSTLILTSDMRGAILVTATEAGRFAGWSAQQMADIAPAIAHSLSDRYEAVLPLGAQGDEQLSGLPHALMGYWLRQGKMDVQLDILACVTEEGWLYEADLFTLSGDQALRAYLHIFLAQTLVYTPPVNGLNP